MLEIQSFFLCEEARFESNGNNTIVNATSETLWPKDGRFPLQAQITFVLLLRNTTASREQQPFELAVRVYDENNIQLPTPSDHKDLTFPQGSRFWRISGFITFFFPSTGLYHIEVELTNQCGYTHTVWYDIQVVNKPAERPMAIQNTFSKPDFFYN